MFRFLKDGAETHTYHFVKMQKKENGSAKALC
jgi:hypothetical protein